MASIPEPVFLLEKLLVKIGLSTTNAEGHIVGLIPDHVAYTWLVMGLILLAGWLATRNMKFVPSGIQNVFETIIGGLENFVVGVMGENGRKVFPFLASVFIFIVGANYMGLLPGGDSATANINTTAALAVITFCYYQYWGIRLHGVKYVKHFMGPILFMAPLLFVIEIVGHLARILSLSLRLFGNITGEEIVLNILLAMLPVYLSFVMLPLYMLFGLADVLQGFVFFLLATIYLQGAFEEAH